MLDFITNIFKKKKTNFNGQVIEIWDNENCSLLNIIYAQKNITAHFKFINKDDFGEDLNIYLYLLPRVIIKDKNLNTNKRNSLATHNFTAIFIDKIPPIYTETEIANLRIDAVGLTFVWDKEERYAKRIIRNLALHVAKIPATKVETWEQQIRRLNWIELINNYAKHQIGQYHEI